MSDNEMMDPEKIVEAAKAKLCDCPSAEKIITREKKFTYVLVCKVCGARGPFAPEDEGEE